MWVVGSVVVVGNVVVSCSVVDVITATEVHKIYLDWNMALQFTEK